MELIMILFSEEDLKILFPNQIQRDIFIKGMNKLVDYINSKTITVPFVELKCHEI